MDSRTPLLASCDAGGADVANPHAAAPEGSSTSDERVLEVRTPVSPKPTGLFTRLRKIGGRRTLAQAGGDIQQERPRGRSSQYLPNTQQEPEPGREDIREVFSVLEGYSVHMVYAGVGDNSTPAVLTQQGGPSSEAEVAAGGVCMASDTSSLLRVPNDTEAVLILADLHYPHAAIPVVRKFKAHVPLPVIVLILHPSGAAKDLSVLVCAAGVLATAPADDVLVQPSNKDDLPAMLAVTMEKLDARQASKRAAATPQSQRTAAHCRDSFGSNATTAAGTSASSSRCPSAASSVSSTSSGERQLAPTPEQVLKESPAANAGAVPQPGQRQEQRRHSHNSQSSKMWDECRLLRRLKHPNVIRVQNIVDAELSRGLPGALPPNLKRTISAEGGRFTLPRAQVTFWQLCAGVAYCHEQRIAHRNLKPESILVTEHGQVQISNFALAVRLGSPCRDKCGTMPFVAPEVLRGQRYDASAADVWSMAVVLLEMLCGINKLPRMLAWSGPSAPSSERANDLEHFFSAQASFLGSVEVDIGGKIPGSLARLLTGLLAVMPGARWTAMRARDSQWPSEGAAEALACCAQAPEEDEEGSEPESPRCQAKGATNP